VNAADLGLLAGPVAVPLIPSGSLRARASVRSRYPAVSARHPLDRSSDRAERTGPDTHRLFTPAPTTS